MQRQYDPNPLKDITFEQAIYLHSTAPVGSDIWNNAGYVLSNYQQHFESLRKQTTASPLLNSEKK